MRFSSKVRLATIVATVAATLLSLAGCSDPPSPPSRNGPRRLVRDKFDGLTKRVALVIGNGAYQFVGRLNNPADDAREMAKTLKELNFEVSERIDCDKRQLEAAIDEFGKRLAESGKDTVGMFYYAGHGVELKGRNYLVPVDADVKTESDVQYRGVDAGFVLGKMEDAKNAVNIVILDACRDNPFARAFRSEARGLAEVTAPRGTLIAYATSPRKTATDSGEYRKALIAAMTTPELNVLDVFQEVTATVDRATNGNQTPWMASSLTGKFYFIPPKAKPSSSGKDESEATERKAGDVMTVAHGMEAVYIPAGEFQMGSADGWFNGDEKPAHQVVFSEAFWMGKYEVTQAQWEAVMGANPSYFKGCPQCPVKNVSWDDCQEFIKKLNERKDGWEYRLPSEAEWEYACRAGTTGDYAGELDEMAWYGSFSGTHPVGEKKANAWGLHDMHGNVSEWCQDRWHENYDGAPNDGHAWEQGSDNRRVVRGGSWNDFANYCRAAFRYRLAPGDRGIVVGVRLAVRLATN
jgi:formylglycine-generating enzyme required for sulfatase activity